MQFTLNVRKRVKMTAEEKDKYRNLFPKTDTCPDCNDTGNCVAPNEIDDFEDYVKDGRLEWCLHAISPSFDYKCTNCGKTWVRTRHGQGDSRWTPNN